MKLLNKIITTCLFMFSIALVGCGNNGNGDFVSPTISLSEKKVNLSVGQTFTLKAETSKTSMLVYWFTRDSAIASVDNNGVVTALSVGNTICYAQVGTNTAMCAINVSPYEPDSALVINCSSTDITLASGDSYKLPIEVKFGASVIDEFTTKADIENKTICSYENGYINALSNGETNLLLTVIYADYFDQLLFTILVA